MHGQSERSMPICNGQEEKQSPSSNVQFSEDGNWEAIPKKWYFTIFKVEIEQFDVLVCGLKLVALIYLIGPRALYNKP